MNYKRLFDYERWANSEAVAHLQKTPAERPVRLLAHILAAHSLWLSRLHGETGPTPVWPAWSLDECAAQVEQLHPRWMKFLESPDFERVIRYRNSKGEEHASRVEDVVLHVILHGAYHRGQMASIVRAAGDEPPYTDYIHCTRMGFI